MRCANYWLFWLCCVCYCVVCITVSQIFTCVLMPCIWTWCEETVNVICPEVTLCGWQDIKIQELNNLDMCNGPVLIQWIKSPIPQADGQGWHIVNGKVGGIVDREFLHAERAGWNPGGAAPAGRWLIKNTQSLKILMTSGLRWTYVSARHSVSLRVRDIQVWQPSRTMALVPVAKG